MSKTLRSILILPVLIFLVGVACNLSGSATPSKVITPTKVSQQLPQILPTKEIIPTSPPEQKPDQITFSISEDQMTANMIQNMPEDVAASLSNPKVKFNPGQVELTATIKGDIISADGRIVMTVNIDPDGKAKIDILDANLGPFPVPPGLLSDLSTAVDNAIADSMKEYQSEYRLESVTFSTGVATIVLTKK